MRNLLISALIAGTSAALACDNITTRNFISMMNDPSATPETRQFAQSMLTLCALGLTDVGNLFLSISNIEPPVSISAHKILLPGNDRTRFQRLVRNLPETGSQAQNGLNPVVFCFFAGIKASEYALVDRPNG
jgi:hypothetical protein